MTREWKNFNDITGDSPLAEQVSDTNDHRNARERREDENVDVFVVHMTGASIVKDAVEQGAEPFEYCLNYYTGKDASVHYLLGYDGRLFQMTDEHLRVGHVGVYAAERAAYLSGAWAEGETVQVGNKELGPISEHAVAHWRENWPAYNSPQHLFRTRYVNNVSVGVEMPPCGYYKNGSWEPFPHVNRHKNTRHTVEQHIGVAALACDIAERWGWPDRWWEDPEGGPRSPHLVGHEDVDLFGRSDRGGGWDPGYLRDSPRWD